MIRARVLVLAGWIMMILALACAGCAATHVNMSSLESASGPRSQSTCLPPYLAGLLAGRSTKREVTRLLGDGYQTERDGIEVRMYTDSSKSTTLVVEFGTDYIVTAVTFWDRLEAGLPSAAVDSMVSTEVYADVGFRGWETKAAVQENMGKPNTVWNDSGLTVWSYESRCACELSTGYSFSFDGDRVISFGVWASNG